MKTKEINNIAKTSEVKINLDNPKNPECITKDSKVLVDHKKNIFGSEDPIGTGFIEISYTISNANVKIDEDLDLLTISSMGKRGKIVNLTIEKINEIPFDIYFDYSAIVDCSDRGCKEFVINYTVKVKMDKDNESKEKSGEITVILEKLVSKPELSLKIREIEYNASTVEDTLIICNSNTHAYAPTISIRPTSIYFEKNYEKIMDVAHIHYGEACPAGPNKDYLPFGVPILTETRQNGSSYPADYVKRIFPKAGYEMDVPISLDFSNICNPSETAEEYKLVIEYEYWTDDNPENPELNQRATLPFTLLRNNARNELRVELQDVSCTNVINESFHVPSVNIKKQDEDDGEMSYPFQIHIRNAANVMQSAYPNAGIVIKNLSIGDLTLDNANAFNKTDRVEPSVFAKKEISGKRVDSGNVKLFPMESVDIEIIISPGHVTRFSDLSGTEIFNADLCQRIQFDYYVDSTGEDKPEWRKYDSCVLFGLEIPPTSEWMGVDFGTSAVVALYGNSRNDNLICDLEGIKWNILRAAYGNTDGRAKVEDEKMFINSNIVLNDKGNRTEGFKYTVAGGGMSTTNYREARILFSPGDQFDYNKLLPSLKSMMGHKRVPSKDQRPDYRDKMPLVDDVYQTAYNELFDLYLSRITDGRKVEKIVMTYPNTFATLHVQRLKEMAKKCLHTLRDDYIVTISESDAIAYKYLTRRKKLLESANLDQHISENIDQHVLVYDMGAGTLDITYFTNILNKVDNKREVDIVGKYGISKAGNYLDYVLAEIVVELCEVRGFKEATSGAKLKDYISCDAKRTLEIGACYELKKYVKNVLKPAMAEFEDAESVPENVMMPEWKGMSFEKRVHKQPVSEYEDTASVPGGEWETISLNLNEIPLKEVFNNPKFTTFIKNVSTDVVQGCKANIDNMSVDVVVFSGRMTCFKSIRKAVVDALGERDTISLDITEGHGNNFLKSSVIEGALNYVETFIKNEEFRMLPKRLFYCSYCVLVRLYDDTILVHCVINNKTTGFMAKERINLSNADDIYLLQTYAHDIDSIKKDFEGNRDLTTVLVHRKVHDEQGLHDVTVRVETSSDDKFKQGTSHVLLMLDACQIRTLPKENFESDAFIKSSWPVVFV